VSRIETRRKFSRAQRAELRADYRIIQAVERVAKPAGLVALTKNFYLSIA